jgi:hypothetical protein
MKAYAVALSALAIGVAVAIPAFAQEALQPSGSFKTQGGFKLTGDNVEVAKGHSLTSGLIWGATFNDAGSGPLHAGTVVCTSSIENINGAGTGEGQCAWSDADGKSQIFTSWSGKFSATAQFAGPQEITGGTGRYSGIKGQAPFHCLSSNEKGQFACAQEWQYQITKQ